MFADAANSDGSDLGPPNTSCTPAIKLTPIDVLSSYIGQAKIPTVEVKLRVAIKQVKNIKESMAALSEIPDALGLRDNSPNRELVLFVRIAPV